MVGVMAANIVVGVISITLVSEKLITSLQRCMYTQRMLTVYTKCLKVAKNIHKAVPMSGQTMYFFRIAEHV